MRALVRISLLVAIATALFLSFFLHENAHAERTDIKPAVGPTCTAAPPGMISWWDAEGSGRDIRGENNGTLNGSPTFPNGEVEHGFGLNGSTQYVEVPDSPSLSMANQLTIDAWINPNNTSSNQTILSKYDTCSGEQRSYTLDLLNGGLVEFCVYNGQPDPNAYRCVVTGNGAINAGIFSHVAGTFDASSQTMKLYINGADTGAGSLAGSVNVNQIFDSNTPVDIGRFFCAGSFPGPGDPFNGSIDEVEFFDRALSSTEI